MNRNLYCVLGNGELVPKRKVDEAIELIAKMKDGMEVVELTDAELFTYGSKFEAILRFREKYDTGLLEAKSAIEFLRGEEIGYV